MPNTVHDIIEAKKISNVSPLEFLAFTLDGDEYGIDIQRVQELRGYDTVTRIANVPEYIKGVINLRGMIVPIVDMRIKLHLGTPSYDQSTVVIVLNLGKSVIGMVVDSVSDVIVLTAKEIKSAPEIGNSIASDSLIGVGVMEQRMLLLIDVVHMMAKEDFGLMEKIAA